jgi:uncharacterized protein (TIGR02301 family)
MAQEAGGGAPRTAPLPTLDSQTIFANETLPRPIPPPSAQDRRRDYENEARELAAVMGAAHYLRWICYGREEQTWRGFMSEFLQREDQRLRTSLAQAFNTGFDAERERFDRCTPSAQASEVQWKERGMRLADTLSARLRD